MDFQYIRTNGLELHAAVAGPPQGRLLVLLHGFPEFWYCWRKQIEYFAALGYRVIAPDQRGYNLSSKPDAISSYFWYELTADVVGIIDATERQQAIIVGHDWGGSAAWYTAMEYPSRVERLVILNSPHPAVLRRHLRKDFSQKRKSWYMFFFQIPWLPELLMRSRNWSMLSSVLIRSSRPGTFQQEDLQKYREAWSKPDSIKCMVHWYRAMSQNKRKITNRRIAAPTLILWGKQDVFLGESMAKESLEFCDRGDLVLFDDARHLIQEEQPQSVNHRIEKFLVS